MMEKKRLLIIDDDLRIREATRFVFEGDFEISVASTKEEALAIYDREVPDAVFLDIDLNGLPQGWEVLREIRSRGRKALILIITGQGEEKENPLASEADAFFIKPCAPKPIREFLGTQGMLPKKN